MIETGLESSLLDALIRDERTVEARLRRDKFLEINVGDKLSIRRDVWEGDNIIESVPEVAFVEVIGLIPFDSFTELLEFIDFRRVMPNAKSTRQALKQFRRFYSEAEEKACGVIAIEINLLAVDMH